MALASQACRGLQRLISVSSEDFHLIAWKNCSGGLPAGECNRHG
jgi:hypothetical protein